MKHYFTKVAATLALAAFALSPVGHAKDAENRGAGGGALEEKMVGYWAPDPVKMLELIKEQIGEDPNAQAMIPMIQAMLSKMAVEVKRGEVNMHMAGQVQKSTYKITKADPAANKLTMMVADGDADPKEGTATIVGDRLTLSKDGDDVLLTRIDQAEFAKRKAAAQQPPAFPKE